MAQTESRAPSNNLVVLGFCELWGLILGLPPGEDLYHGAAVTLRMITFLVIGGAFAILGPTWPLVKSKFPSRLAVTLVRAASDFRWWLVLLLVLLFLAPLTSMLGASQNTGKSTSFDGTTEIPADAYTATIPVPISPPYVVHSLSADWGATVRVTDKGIGNFSVEFQYPAPSGGGELDWEVSPRTGSHTVALTEQQMPTATPTSTPLSPIEGFVDGRGNSVGLCQYIISSAPTSSAGHKLDIISTEQSHDIALRIVGCVQVGKWQLLEHGQPESYIGNPTEYALDDGFTIRAKATSVDAETIRFALHDALSIDAKRVVLPDNDVRDYVILEIGNFPNRLPK